MVEGCAKFVKYGLYAANVVVLIGGIVVFSVGIWTLSDRTFMEPLLGSDLYVSSASILIASGIIVAIISFLGCFGAYKEVKCMLLTFFIILFMIFIIMLVGGILGYIFRNEVDSRMHSEMLMTIPKYANVTAITEAWDNVQTRFMCCGISMDSSMHSYEVWRRKNIHFDNRKQIPRSCCRSREDLRVMECQHSPREDNAFTRDCYNVLKNFVKGHAVLVGGFGIGISCILIVGMVLSCALFLMIN